MSDTAKVLLIIAIVVIALVVLIGVVISRLKKKVKKTLEKVDRAGEYATRILRIAAKVKNGETRAMLTDIADDFKLSELKEIFTADDRLDAILDLLETEADTEDTDELKLSQAVLSLKDVLAEKLKNR